MVLNTFTRAADDNWNRVTDSVTGEHLAIVNFIIFQSNQKDIELGSFNNSTNTSRAPLLKERKRSLTADQLATQIFNCLNLQGNNISPLHLKNRLNLDQYFVDSLSHSATRDNDRAWIFLRICPPTIFEIQLENRTEQLIPEWSAFHAKSLIYQAFQPVYIIVNLSLLHLPNSTRFILSLKGLRHFFEGLDSKLSC